VRSAKSVTRYALRVKHRDQNMILLIDTSQELGSAALSDGAEVLFSEENKIAKEHASWLHVAIGKLLTEAKITVRDLEAVAVVAGPGSYTGLRVGMAAAKGFCYALKIPLITENTLRVMAESMILPAQENNALICPMIDARRDEVFTALYKHAEGLRPKAEGQTPAPRNAGVIEELSEVNNELKTVTRQLLPREMRGSTVNDLSELLKPQAQILDKSSFETQLAAERILFFGSGAEKWKKITDSPHALIFPQPSLTEAFAKLADRNFRSGTFADPVYSEPVYLKEFFSY
jgi:tRNA threonylcarbamoyladenosine biosynthesis protein TsaB